MWIMNEMINEPCLTFGIENPNLQNMEKMNPVMTAMTLGIGTPISKLWTKWTLCWNLESDEPIVTPRAARTKKSVWTQKCWEKQSKIDRKSIEIHLKHVPRKIIRDGPLILSPQTSIRGEPLILFPQESIRGHPLIRFPRKGIRGTPRIPSRRKI